MSNSNSNSSGGGIGIVELLLAIFITLKLCNVIEWSWWWVLSPVWGIVIIIFLIYIGIWLGLMVGDWWRLRKWKKANEERLKRESSIARPLDKNIATSMLEETLPHQRLEENLLIGNLITNWWQRRKLKKTLKNIILAKNNNTDSGSLVLGFSQDESKRYDM